MHDPNPMQGVIPNLAMSCARRATLMDALDAAMSPLPQGIARQPRAQRRGRHTIHESASAPFYRDGGLRVAIAVQQTE